MHETASDNYSGYETDILEFQSAGNWDFLFGENSVKLYTHDSYGGFTLERLLYRPSEDSNHSVRAEFSCNITASGGFIYNTGDVYNKLLRFFPDDSSVFPKIVNDNSSNEWFAVLETNDPLSALGISADGKAELRAEVNITAFTVHHTQNNTVYYVTISIS